MGTPTCISGTATRGPFEPDFILDDNGGWDTDNDCIPDGAPNAPDGMPDWTDATDCNPLSMDSDDDDLLDPIDPLPADADIDDDGLTDGEEDRSLNGFFDGDLETDLGMNYPGDPDYDCKWTDCSPVGIPTAMRSPTARSAGGPRPRWIPCTPNLDCFVEDADPLTTTDPSLADSDGDGVDDGVEDADHNGRQNKR